MGQTLWVISSTLIFGDVVFDATLDHAVLECKVCQMFVYTCKEHDGMIMEWEEHLLLCHVLCTCTTNWFAKVI